MKKLLTFLIAFVFCGVSAYGAMSWDYGWEDGTGTALSQYGANLYLSNSTEQAYEGTHSLKMIEDPLSGTPQAFVWWVTGLSEGDGIVASFYMYDTTPGGSPSGRIWGHYTSDPTNINSYSGSASGNLEYSDGSGWTNLQWSWTFDSDGGANDGFVCEARIYAGSGGNVVYVDTASITVSNNNAKIYNAAGDSIPEPITLSVLVLGLGALFLRRK